MTTKLKIVHAVLAGVQILTAGTALASFVGEKPAALIVLVVGAFQVGLATFEGTPQPTAPAELPSGQNMQG